MKKRPTYITELEKIYKNMGNSWCSQNSLILYLARKNKLVLGGSIGIAITRKKAHKIPGDFDFFTTSYDDAWKFVSMLMNYLSKKSGTYGEVKFQNETKFTLKGVKNYFRIIVPFWLPICVMVLEEPVRTFYWETLAVQFFDDIVDAAKTTTAIDKKTDRISFLDIDLNDDLDLWLKEDREISAPPMRLSSPTDFYIT